MAWKRNAVHEGYPSLLWSIFWNNNPWEQPPSKRSQWAKDLNVPLYDPNQHEVLYYVGCTPSYDTRAQKIARSLVKILQAANVSFGIMGDQEPCSGEEALSVGHKKFFEEISEKAATTLNSWGVTRLITSDPHSFDSFKNHYRSVLPQELSIPNIAHYVEFLDELLRDGRLVLNALTQEKPLNITYHDPCYLSRHNGVITAPRNILKAIPNVCLVEMQNYGSNTLCCGGGGGRMWVDTDPGERFSDLRIAEAQETGAEIMATACPYCISCLEDSLKSQGFQDFVVMDIAEIVPLALD
jgi:Fe-S oxidoreductase